MKIVFLGRVSDAAGCTEMACAPPAHVATVAALRDWLAARDPALSETMQSRSVRAIVDHAFAPDDTPIAGAKEIAFAPPLSGG